MVAIAHEAHLRARLELARVLGDPIEERAVGRKLAEHLASRDSELDAAIELALRTLAAGDDPELRHALAGWLEGLGEPGLAASELRKIRRDDDSVAAAAVLVRIGVLHARAGDAFGAHEALAEAAELDEIDALSLELLGAIAAWAPEALTPRAAAEAYVRAAKRRGHAGDTEGELEDLLRAFERDATSPLATAALVAARMAKDRVSAADEVLRAHAKALEAIGGAAAGDAAEVHARRRTQALERGDLARALGAALDESLDAVFDGPDADAIDDLLVRAGAFDALAIRLEVRAERAASSTDGRAASKKWADLGRLLSGPLASTERAIEAYARSVAADATGADSLHALRSLACEGHVLTVARSRGSSGRRWARRPTGRRPTSRRGSRVRVRSRKSPRRTTTTLSPRGRMASSRSSTRATNGHVPLSRASRTLRDVVTRSSSSPSARSGRPRVRVASRRSSRSLASCAACPLARRSSPRSSATSSPRDRTTTRRSPRLCASPSASPTSRRS